MHGITDTEGVRPGDVAPADPEVPVSLDVALASYRAKTDARRARRAGV